MEIAALLRERGLRADISEIRRQSCPPLDTDPRLDFVRRFLDAAGQRKPSGVHYFSDASILAMASVPSVLFGPGDIAQAHTADEWISLRSLESADPSFAAISPIATVARANMSYDSKTAFVRQSSWMVIATFVGGMLMTLVHTVARKMGAEDYATFVTLLRLLIVLGIPSAALQTVFAQQAADAHDEEREQQLAATTRAILGLTFLLWLVVGLGVLGAYQPICRALKIADPVVAGLNYGITTSFDSSLRFPVLKGLPCKGCTGFGGLGWLQIVDGVGRFGMTLVFVLALNGKAASTMFGCAIGQIATLALGAWFTRDIWTRHRAAAFPWRRWIKRALPLTMGLAAVLLMSSIDMLFVENHFSDTRLTALYGGAMLTGFAIVQFIAPVAAVMFPRIVTQCFQKRRRQQPDDGAGGDGAVRLRGGGRLHRSPVAAAAANVFQKPGDVGGRAAGAVVRVGAIAAGGGQRADPKRPGALALRGRALVDRRSYTLHGRALPR